MKNFHLFSWWLNPENLDRVAQAYAGSYETIELARVAVEHVADNSSGLYCDILETQADGSLKWVLSGEQYANGEWRFYATAD